MESQGRGHSYTQVGGGARPVYCLWVVCAVVVGINHIELREGGRFSSHLPKLFIRVLCAVSNI